MTSTLHRQASPLVVASVPADHPYIRHLGPENGEGPVRLRDPEPDAASKSTQQQWWPPVMLEPEWVERHDFDEDPLPLHYTLHLFEKDAGLIRARVMVRSKNLLRDCVEEAVLRVKRG